MTITPVLSEIDCIPFATEVQPQWINALFSAVKKRNKEEGDSNKTRSVLIFILQNIADAASLTSANNRLSVLKDKGKKFLTTD
jgi:hypothetical protein